MQTPFASRTYARHAKAPARLNQHPAPAHAAATFPNDRPLGFTRHELRHMVAEMIG